MRADEARRGDGGGQPRVEHGLHDRGGQEDREERARSGQAHDGGAEPARGVAEQVVEAQHRRATRARHRACDDDLLDREEGAGLAGADGHVADHRREHDNPRMLRDEQQRGGEDGEQGEGAQGRPRAQALGRTPHRPRQRGAAAECARHRQPDAPGVHSVLGEVHGQQDSEEPVAERPDRLGEQDRGDRAQIGT